MEKRNKYYSRDFILLLIGQTISQFGTGMTNFALIIWVYTKSEQAMASSLLAVCSMIPYLVVSLVGGAVVDRKKKKTIMLVCDAIAAFCSCILLICFLNERLELWIICVLNAVGGLMNAFQNPASQVAVSILVSSENYAKVGGMQSIANAVVGILTPVLGAGLLNIGGLSLIVLIDLGTFFFAFITLLLFVRIPDLIKENQKAEFHEIVADVKKAYSFIKTYREIWFLLLMYSVLEFIGAVSFDSMYSPLLLARTGNNELVVGVVSVFMAVGCLSASILITFMKKPKRKLPVIYLGSFLCLSGITLFGMGRTIWQWCVIVFLGCFGSPIYSTYQTVLLRECVPLDMQGRIFSLQGMMTGILSPIGFLVGAFLADHVLEPFMNKRGKLQSIFAFIVGEGRGAGIGLIFVAAGISGMIFLGILIKNRKVKEVESSISTFHLIK